MRKKRRLRTDFLAFAIGAAAFAQAPEKIAFEVATVKPAAPNEGLAAFSLMGPKGGPGTNDPGRWTCRDCRIKGLIIQAYDLEGYQVTVPAWAENQSYDIAAKVPSGATKEQLWLMIQNLLTERFKLTFHRESKEMAVYNLVIAKGGPKLIEHVEAPPKGLPEDPTAKEAHEDPFAELRGPGRAPERDKDGFPVLHCDRCGMNLQGKARINSLGVTLQEFANQLHNWVDKRVVDSTGLSGKYDISVKFDATATMAMRRAAMGLPPSPASGTDGASDPIGALPVQDAIQVQLGLKLESAKQNVEMFVVDHAEKTPTEN